MIFLSIISTSVGLASVESTSGKTVFTQNEEPMYFASLNFGKNLLPDFKNKFRFVNGGFFIRPLSRSGINFASIFGNLPIFREWTVFTTSPTIK